ncbi:DUF4468 domain-containing protein [Pedobacter caeni]|uniref:DUF4468 domain-containing protein n=1 Tax=Pedobacter caeni TaxID=288992 RepID=A0A1M5F6N1_9SPHI|nr:DUF4468 domain-containing protein [Pedobacter caeni]SHF87179.1 protein of unknown function [Pedobacter caeni]
MRKLLIVVLLFPFAGFAQDVELPFDERGKFIYYEVVSQKEVKAEVLMERAAKFFNSSKELKLQTSPQDSLWMARGKMVINKTAFVLSRPSGEVWYHLYADFKEGKYRFWLTDFSFISYHRDRYGNFVPETTVAIPLENKPGKLNAGEWTAYSKATAREAKLFAERFKKGMSESAINPPTAKAVPTVDTKNQKW